MKRIAMDRVRKTTQKGDKEAFKVPSKAKCIQPTARYIVNLDTEDTDFLIVYSDESTVVLLAMDASYETISIPVEHFLRGKYIFKVDGKRYVAKLTIREDD